MLDGVATTRDGTLKTSRGHNGESGGRDVGSHIGALVTLQREIDEEPVIHGEVHDDQHTRDRRMTGRSRDRTESVSS